MTVDETWARQWVGPGSTMSKAFKAQPSAGKVMATVFWDAKGVIMLDFLPKKYNNWSVLSNLARPDENRHPCETP